MYIAAISRGWKGELFDNGGENHTHKYKIKH